MRSLACLAFAVGCSADHFVDTSDAGDAGVTDVTVPDGAPADAPGDAGCVTIAPFAACLGSDFCSSFDSTSSPLGPFTVDPQDKSEPMITQDRAVSCPSSVTMSLPAGAMGGDHVTLSAASGAPTTGSSVKAAIDLWMYVPASLPPTDDLSFFGISATGGDGVALKFIGGNYNLVISVMSSGTNVPLDPAPTPGWNHMTLSVTFSTTMGSVVLNYTNGTTPAYVAPTATTLPSSLGMNFGLIAQATIPYALSVSYDNVIFTP